MDLSHLTTGDTLIKHKPEIFAGEGFGAEVLYVPSDTLDGLVQVLSSSEAADHGWSGERKMTAVMFSEDPGLDVGDVLKWTSQGGKALLSPQWLRVVGIFSEGAPNELPVLWNADAEITSIRPEEIAATPTTTTTSTTTTTTSTTTTSTTTTEVSGPGEDEGDGSGDGS